MFNNEDDDDGSDGEDENDVDYEVGEHDKNDGL